jgi:hypothetical protein
VRQKAAPLHHLPRAPVADMTTLQQTSIIIPFAPDDLTWKALLSDFNNLPDTTEVILVAANKKSAQEVQDFLLATHIQVISTAKGRAAQMNAGASAASNPCLWFLHADSRIDAQCVKAIDSFDFSKNTLAYFGLKFSNDGPEWMGINRFGVWFRSRFLRIPFGDQGFVISKSCFEMLGAFREDLSSGEDHAFVWKARKNEVALKHLNASIQTSARKYMKYGWGKTTRLHLRETWRQAQQFSKQAKI